MPVTVTTITEDPPQKPRSAVTEDPLQKPRSAVTEDPFPQKDLKIAHEPNLASPTPRLRKGVSERATASTKTKTSVRTSSHSQFAATFPISGSSLHLVGSPKKHGIPRTRSAGGTIRSRGRAKQPRFPTFGVIPLPTIDERKTVRWVSRELEAIDRSVDIDASDPKAITRTCTKVRVIFCQ